MIKDKYYSCKVGCHFENLSRVKKKSNH